MKTNTKSTAHDMKISRHLTKVDNLTSKIKATGYCLSSNWRILTFNLTSPTYSTGLWRADGTSGRKTHLSVSEVQWVCVLLIECAQLKCPVWIMRLGVTVMKRQCSLTLQAMVFHIHPRKALCLQFLIVGQTAIMPDRVVMGLLMNVYHEIF